jgi:hypothetical protein
MWLTILNATPPDERRGPLEPPAHCPHPASCLRLPVKEPRSFNEDQASRRAAVDSYRWLMARQCACNGHGCESKL